MISAFGVDHGGISKSLVNGVFKPASALSHAERGAVGGYKQAKGVSAAHQQFKLESAARHHHLANSPAESMTRSALMPPGMRAKGVTYRLGSAKGGRSVVDVQGNDKRAMDQVMSHERQHAAPRRSEYRMHGQIIKDPIKTMREEARADVTSQAGHYRKQQKDAMKGRPVSVYAGAAITGKPAHIQRAYPNMSTADAKKGIHAYKSVQDKIARNKGMKEAKKPRFSTKQKVAGGTVVGVGGVTALGGLEHHAYERKQRRG